MRISKRLNKPLPVLVGYLTAINADCECPCFCKKEVWLAEGCDDEEAAEWAEDYKIECIAKDDYDDCIKRQVFERVIEALNKGDAK